MEAELLPLDALMARDNYSGQNESETMELRKKVRKDEDLVIAIRLSFCCDKNRLPSKKEKEEEQDNRFMTPR